ncbi:MAG: GNAT family acetyltransferase [Pseudomonas sp.]|uniref:GNAT family acetyltransferase n=1 Tax=Pseudomonas sp. TaxID=306 RepID=UPI0033934E15
MHVIATYSDAHHRQGVTALWGSAFGEQTGHNTPSLSIDKKRAMEDGLFFVALAGTGVIGTVLAGYDGHRGWLYSVAVHPAHRNQGVGGALIRHAEAALSTKGCMKINLQILATNESVTAFYAALGYVIEPRISMGKKIEANID